MGITKSSELCIPSLKAPDSCMRVSGISARNSLKSCESKDIFRRYCITAAIFLVNPFSQLVPIFFTARHYAAKAATAAAVAHGKVWHHKINIAKHLFHTIRCLGCCCNWCRR